MQDDDDGPSLFQLSQTVTAKLGHKVFGQSCTSHTGSKSLDSLLSLENGRLWNGLTEICGPPGIGKTQIALSMCISAIMSKFDGLSTSSLSRVFFVDTEGTAMPDRIRELIISSLNEHFDVNDDLQERIVESAMSNFMILRISTSAELIAITNVLAEYIQDTAGETAAIVIFDSIASPMRTLAQDLPLRSKLLSMIGQGLVSTAARYDVPIIVTNSMTTKVSATSGDKGILIPALGEAWAQLIGSRIILYWREDIRYAFLQKAAPHLHFKESTSIPFCVVREGIRDVRKMDAALEHSSPSQHEEMALRSSQILSSDDILTTLDENSGQKRKFIP